MKLVDTHEILPPTRSIFLSKETLKPNSVGSFWASSIILPKWVSDLRGQVGGYCAVHAEVFQVGDRIGDGGGFARLEVLQHHLTPDGALLPKSANCRKVFFIHQKAVTEASYATGNDADTGNNPSLAINLLVSSNRGEICRTIGDT